MSSILEKLKNINEVVSDINGVKVIYNTVDKFYFVNDENLINTLGTFDNRLEAEDFANAKRVLK